MNDPWTPPQPPQPPVIIRKGVSLWLAVFLIFAAAYVCGKIAYEGGRDTATFDLRQQLEAATAQAEQATALAHLYSEYRPLYTRTDILKPIHDIVLPPHPRTITYTTGSQHLIFHHLGCTYYGATIAITGSTGRDTDRAALAQLIIRETLDGITYTNAQPQCSDTLTILFLDDPPDTAAINQAALPPNTTVATYTPETLTLYSIPP